MNFKYEISNYSSNPNRTIEAICGDTTFIIDKLIRLAAKLTEEYASDIVYTIDGYKSAVEEARDFDQVLLFRESGVNTYRPNGDIIERADFLSRGIQAWRLTFDSDSGVTRLKRVTLSAHTGWTVDHVGGST